VLDRMDAETDISMDEAQWRSYVWTYCKRRSIIPRPQIIAKRSSDSLQTFPNRRGKNAEEKAHKPGTLTIADWLPTS